MRAWLKNEFLKDDDYKKTYYLHLPRWIFSLGRENLKSLLEGIIDGDGTHITKSTGFQISTTSKAFGEDLLELALLIGKTGNLRTLPPKIRTFPAGHTSICKEQYVVSINDKVEHLFDIRTASVTKEHYTGTVYCVNLESEHRLFVMRNGKSVWCGNCANEIVRHRVASFSQESTRYVNYSGEGPTFIRPNFFKTKEDEQLWRDTMALLAQTYKTMIEHGMTPQEARCVLPNSLKTELIMTANIREWRHFLKLRTDSATHPQMRQVACQLLDMCKEKIPVLFDDINY